MLPDNQEILFLDINFNTDYPDIVPSSLSADKTDKIQALFKGAQLVEYEEHVFAD